MIIGVGVGIISVDVVHYGVHVVTGIGVIQRVMEGMHPLCRDNSRRIYCGIRSESESNAMSVKAFLKELSRRIDLGETLYIHCNGDNS